MVLNETTFKNLLENLPSIEVIIESESESESEYIEIRERELVSGYYLVIADFNVHESIEACPGDYLTPPSVTSNRISVYNVQFEVSHLLNDEEIHLTDSQKEELNKTIQSLIYTTV